MSANFDHGEVGQVYPHDQAALTDKSTLRTQRPGSSVSRSMFVAVTFGAFVGYLLSTIFAPGFALPFVVGCAMSFGAITVAFFLFKPVEPDEYSTGLTRNEEEVRQALADIEARKK